MRWYDLHGNEISMFEAERQLIEMRESGMNRIGKDVLPDGRLVSTVFLSLDHGGFPPGSPPLIFETMVFQAENCCDIEIECQRYSTLDEARRGHEETVARLSMH